ncbi:hypothetical protein TWF481_009158 [Arthrobotrys musiformis]|uniref:Uncharacterized protein n=1 Tax=Arthrobotrys musiformis TaxID=47236 RepID=A0AAV9W4U2_9PEZI
MIFQYFTILLILLGSATTAPVSRNTPSDKGLYSLKARQTGHQEHLVNLDEKTQEFWLEMAYGDAFSHGGVFKNPFTDLDGMPKYEAIMKFIDYMFRPPVQTLEKGTTYFVPHGKCRVLYCNGQNFGISLCSRRKGDEAEVSLTKEAVGNIVKEWAEEFKWQRAMPHSKDDGNFKTPIYGRSFWSEDPGWSINFEECGNTLVNFDEDVLHDT